MRPPTSCSANSPGRHDLGRPSLATKMSTAIQISPTLPNHATPHSPPPKGVGETTAFSYSRGKTWLKAHHVSWLAPRSTLRHRPLLVAGNVDQQTLRAALRPRSRSFSAGR